jgi:hypothetical protein
MDPKDLAARERLAQEEADRLKRAQPRIHVEPLSGERNVTRFGKAQTQASQEWSGRRAVEREPSRRLAEPIAGLSV